MGHDAVSELELYKIENESRLGTRQTFCMIVRSSELLSILGTPYAPPAKGARSTVNCPLLR